MIDTAIILATGSLSHQSRLTYDRPRTMLPALGKPLLVRVMDRFYRVGITQFIVILGEREGNVATYLNTRWHPDVSIQFILKRDSQPLGRTLSAIVQDHNAPFLLASYNSFTHSNFPDRLQNYHNNSPNDLIVAGAINSLSRAATQTFARVLLPHTPNTAATMPRETAEPVKTISPLASDDYQNLILNDMMACGSRFVEFVSDLPDGLASCRQILDIIRGYMTHGHMTRVARSSWVLQISTDEDLITLNRHLLDEKIDANTLSEIPYTVRIVPPVRIDPGVNIGQGAVVGPHVYLEGGSSVGREAVIRNAIVLNNATVAARENVQNAIVSSRGRINVSS